MTQRLYSLTNMAAMSRESFIDPQGPLMSPNVSLSEAPKVWIFLKKKGAQMPNSSREKPWRQQRSRRFLTTTLQACNACTLETSTVAAPAC